MRIGVYWKEYKEQNQKIDKLRNLGRLSLEASFEQEQAIRLREEMPLDKTKRLPFPLEAVEKTSVLGESSFGGEAGERKW